MIPKANGEERPLGIPTVRDRIAQTACKMILEPIFEADFEESSHGFRPKRSSKDAMAAIKAQLKGGKTEVLDADLSKYFDTIPHNKLIIALEERITDKRVIRLIKKWLKVPVYEYGQFKGGKKQKQGTPQGGVISPLLANVYLHLLDKIVNNPRSIFSKYGISIVRYADDFVLMGKTMPKEVASNLNAIIRGWLNYFTIEGTSYTRMSRRRLRHYLMSKLHRYYNRKSQRKSRLYRHNAFEVLVKQFGLIDPTKYSFCGQPVKANEEIFRKAVCGKIARTV